MTPESTPQNTMDIWGNVKIPMLKRNEGKAWQNISRNTGTVQYTSLVGVPVGRVDDGNTSFSLESSYIDLECSNVSTATDSSEIPLEHKTFMSTALSLAVCGDPCTYQDLPNGTWYGIPTSRESNNSFKTTWSLALDRFVDPKRMAFDPNMPLDEYMRFGGDLLRPSRFENETGMETGPTTLLFQAYCTSNDYFPPDLGFTAYCRVSQKYVESQVECSNAASIRSCRVIAQRASQEQHAPEGISHLSFPTLFYYVSREMPITLGVEMSYQSESSLYYIKDPTLKALQSEETRFLEGVTQEDVSIRLGQLLNTYLQLGQLYLNVTTGNDINPAFEPKITVQAESRTPIIIFSVSTTWLALCLVSGIILLGAGILSVIFKHKSRGPEVLGCVSTVFRDSRYMEVQSDSGWLDSNKLSSRMRDQRIRFGVVEFKDGEEFLLGVGPEDETGQIGRKLSWSRSGP
ncbi:hypothetical protein CGCF245_v004007 [Colletotrichum fructicola]|nr:hypothetical protein CGCF245_v004007 [Colletotrichum fructicola]